jgi:hypothetical protein
MFDKRKEARNTMVSGEESFCTDENVNVNADHKLREKG